MPLGGPHAARERSTPAMPPVSDISRTWSAGAVLLSILPEARAWEVEFGPCTFSGPDSGGALVRSGSCPEESGTLDLDNKGITSVPADAFADMGSLG